MSRLEEIKEAIAHATQAGGVINAETGNTWRDRCAYLVSLMEPPAALAEAAMMALADIVATCSAATGAPYHPGPSLPALAVGHVQHLAAFAAMQKRALDMHAEAMKADPDEAGQLEAIASDLEGKDSAEYFVRFRRDYYYALSACDKANEVLAPLSDVLRALPAMNKAGTSLHDVPWFTNTLTGMVTNAIARQYIDFIEANGARNFVELQFSYDGDRALRITIEHPEGKSPGTVVAELKAECVALKHERDEVLAKLAEHPPLTDSHYVAIFGGPFAMTTEIQEHAADARRIMEDWLTTPRRPVGPPLPADESAQVTEVMIRGLTHVMYNGRGNHSYTLCPPRNLRPIQAALRDSMKLPAALALIEQTWAALGDVGRGRGKTLVERAEQVIASRAKWQEIAIAARARADALTDKEG